MEAIPRYSETSPFPLNSRQDSSLSGLAYGQRFSTSVAARWERSVDMECDDPMLRPSGDMPRTLAIRYWMYCPRLADSNGSWPFTMATNITFHPGSMGSSERIDLLKQKGVTIWLTGLSASGKSTIACALEQHLLHLGKFSYRLDGDNIRFGLNKDLGFDEKSRNENIRRIGEVAKLFTDASAITITAFISPYVSDRTLVRELHEKSSLGFIEVFVDAPLGVVEERDPKGLYKKARAGEIKEFTGISAPYEVPPNPEIHIKTNEFDVAQSVAAIVEYLTSKEYI